MDYFNDLLATFLSLDRVYYIAVYGRFRELSECIKNILICVPKMNKAVMPHMKKKEKSFFLFLFQQYSVICLSCNGSSALLRTS